MKNKEETNKVSDWLGKNKEETNEVSDWLGSDSQSCLGEEGWELARQLGIG